MTDSTFNALVLDAPKTTATVQPLSPAQLPDGDVTVRVAYSSLNYKDALAVTGAGKIVRNFPMVPGIDFVGTVEASTNEHFAVGDTVLLTGWGVGERHWGGFAERARVSADWLVPLPKSLTPLDAMTLGTAGFTAMMAVDALERQGLTPESGEVLVTGATGGAGSVAVALLAARGYRVVASTGRTDTHGDWLHALGASEVIGRLDTPERPMLSARWAGAIDSVGGDTLAHTLAATQYGSSVAAFGMAGGAMLTSSVFPFILRGVNLLGIDSVQHPTAARPALWTKAAKLLNKDTFTQLRGETISLADVPQASTDLLNSNLRGRTVVVL